MFGHKGVNSLAVANQSVERDAAADSEKTYASQDDDRR
jgi:hypothetical protein